jgi:plastocyanin
MRSIPVRRRLTRLALAGLFAASTSSCSDGDSGTTPPPGGGDDTTPSAIAVGNGNNQTAAAGAQLPEQLSALVTNAEGAVLSGVTVTWSVEAGGGSLGATTSVTSAQGLAVNTYTLGPVAGANAVRATVQGTSLSTTFTATATQDTVATSMEITGGNGQSAVVGEVLPDPLTVIVKNAAGEPLGGKAVGWSVTAGDGVILQTETLTNSGGVAANFYEMGSAVGTDSIAVVVTGNPEVSTVFTANATAAPTSASVTVQDNTFDADYVVVAAGGTVTWTWAGSNAHDVTWVSGGLANSPTQASGTHSVTFDTPGTYEYYCSIHGSPTSGMRGKIVVKG